VADPTERIVNPHFILVQVDQQIECATRHEPPRRVDRNIVQRPEICDEPRKRWARIVHRKSHDSRMPQRDQRKALFSRCLNTSLKRR
jgi:hypothetical protein